MRSPLYAAIEAVTLARNEADEMAMRIAGLGVQHSSTKTTLVERDAALTEALSAELLGEGTAAAAKKARALRDESLDQIRGLEAALSTLAKRRETAQRKVAELERAARALATPMAQEHSDRELRRARELFENGATALAKWHVMDTFVHGGEVTGEHQIRAHQIGEILRRFGIRLTGNELLIGRADGATTPIGTQQLLALLESPADLAAE